MTRRRALLARVESGGRLPAEYQEVEYIKSTYQQYINTGVVISAGYGFEVTAMYDNETHPYNDGTIRYICGTRQSYNQNRATIQTQNQFVYVETYYATSIDVIPTDRHVYAISNNGVFVDGSLKGSAMILGGGSTPFLIFNISNNGSAIPTSSTAGVDARFWLGRVYNLKLFDNNAEKIHEYIPCYRKSDNKPGMYDIISNVFYTNLGADEFLVGPNIN